MNAGRFTIDRKIKDNPVWQDKPFAKGQAWIDIICRANYQDSKLLFGNEVIDVKRSAFVTSEYKLSRDWGWDRSTVRRFLKYLESEEMINQTKTLRYTVIEVLNYDKHQTFTKPTVEEEDQEEEKEAKKKYAKLVRMTPTELGKLHEKLGIPKTDAMIEKLDNYKGRTGKKYKSDYLTILDWIRKDSEEQSKKQSTRRPEEDMERHERG